MTNQASEPERVTVKDLRVGDRFRWRGGIREMTLTAIGRARNPDGDEWPVSDTSPVEVISRADQFASGVKAAGVAFGRALSASVPQPDGSSRVLVQVGVPLGFHETQQAAAREIGKMLAVQEGGGWCLACGDLAPIGQSLCRRCPAPMVPLAIKLLPPPPASDAYAAMLDALRELSTNAHAKFTADPETAPRCPSMHCDRPVKRLESGTWWCASCSWHGASLTAPPAAAKFSAGQWVRDIAKGTVAQVMRVRVGSPLPYTIVNRDESASVERAESQLEATERPRDDEWRTLPIKASVY